VLHMIREKNKMTRNNTQTAVINMKIKPITILESHECPIITSNLHDIIVTVAMAQLVKQPLILALSD